MGLSEAFSIGPTASLVINGRAPINTNGAEIDQLSVLLKIPSNVSKSNLSICTWNVRFARLLHPELPGLHAPICWSHCTRPHPGMLLLESQGTSIVFYTRPYMAFSTVVHEPMWLTFLIYVYSSYYPSVGWESISLVGELWGRYRSVFPRFSLSVIPFSVSIQAEEESWILLYRFWNDFLPIPVTILSAEGE